MVKTVFFSIILSFLATTQALCQQALLEQIEFKSDFEKSVLSNIDNEEDLGLLLAISEEASPDYASKVRQQIGLFKEKLAQKKFESKDEEKKIKLLFQLGHDYFFKKYEEVVPFHQVFDKQYYNCVSATALYSLLLQEYNIPFSIKEEPTHVYVIAYPNSKSIVLESTAPASGYYSPSSNDIHKIVGRLQELKYVTKEDVEQKGDFAVYKSFFFGDGKISIRNLAGLQYYNEAIQYMEKKQYKEALNACYKSKLLYPSEKIDYIAYGLLSALLSEAVQDDFKDMKAFVYLAQYANLPMQKEIEVEKVFFEVARKKLFNQSEAMYVDSTYQYLKEHIADTVLVNDISEKYCILKGLFYLQKTDFDKGFPLLEQAYQLNDKNVTTQTYIVEALLRSYSRKVGNESSIKELDAYLEKYPFISDNQDYQSFYITNCAYYAYTLFRADDTEEGMKYISKIEGVFEQFEGEIDFNQNTCGLAYAEAGASYYRGKKYKEAKEVIEKGLENMPNHPELLARLEIVMDALKK